MNKMQVINFAWSEIEEFSPPSEMRIGVDPGTRNLGIAVIRPDIESVTLYKITFKRHKKALSRLLDVQQVLGRTIGHFTPNSKVIIEGASYGNFYRQVELAEQRAAILLWFHKYDIEGELIPPLTIRKNVFGSGKVKNPWPEIDDNMAASLGAALFSQDI
jgi:Holliday junction resolvasome RuvABC endonuclease subunit